MRDGGRHRDPARQQGERAGVRGDCRPGMQDFLAQGAIGRCQGIEGRRLGRRGNMAVQKGGNGLPMYMCLDQIGLKRKGQQGKQQQQPSRNGHGNWDGAGRSRHGIWLSVSGHIMGRAGLGRNASFHCKQL